MKKNIRICLISDTHGQHYKLDNLPSADIIIHSGDSTSVGTRFQMQDFLDWFSSLNQYSHRILIGGNHDYYFDKNHPRSINYKLEDNSHLDIIPNNVIYLEDETITIEGLKIFGSPNTPWFYNWAFNRQRGEEIKKHWDLIDSDCDIIISHGPAKGILDRCMDGSTPGCDDLLAKVKEVKPICLISGHIHEAYGCDLIDGIHYFNASVLNHNYEITNKPIIIEINEDKELKIIL